MIHSITIAQSQQKIKLPSSQSTFDQLSERERSITMLAKRNIVASHARSAARPAAPVLRSSSRSARLHVRAEATTTAGECSSPGRERRGMALPREPCIVGVFSSALAANAQWPWRTERSGKIMERGIRRRGSARFRGLGLEDWSSLACGSERERARARLWRGAACRAPLRSLRQPQNS